MPRRQHQKVGPADEVLTAGQVAALTGFYEETVTKALRDGELRGYQRAKGSRWRVYRDDALTWAAGERPAGGAIAAPRRAVGEGLMKKQPAHRAASVLIDAAAAFEPGQTPGVDSPMNVALRRLNEVGAASLSRDESGEFAVDVFTHREWCGDVDLHSGELGRAGARSGDARRPRRSAGDSRVALVAKHRPAANVCDTSIRGD